MSNDTHSKSAREEKLLTFLLGTQEYGIRILEAREVVGAMHIDQVPKTPNFMQGVINLRGKIIPVIDLRTKFDMPKGQPSKESCIVVVDMEGTLTGMSVDFLVGVLTVSTDELEATPQLGTHIRTQFISGIAKLDKRVVIVLDMVNILSNEELSSVQTALATA